MYCPGVLFAPAALRLLQPRIYEPARTSWLLYEWTMHLPRLWAGVLLIGLPGFVTIAGSLLLWGLGRHDHELRQEIVAAINFFRRQATVVLLGAATVLSGGILISVASQKKPWRKIGVKSRITPGLATSPFPPEAS